MQQDSRNQNLSNLDTQYSQNDQIKNIKKDAIDTHVIMKDTNADLRGQRNVINNID